MADLQKQLDKKLQEFLQLDERRRRDPLAGRSADEKMVELCQYVKDHAAQLGNPSRDKVLEKLKSLNLRPYWSYCREHMLDIGLEF